MEKKRGANNGRFTHHPTNKEPRACKAHKDSQSFGLTILR